MLFCWENSAKGHRFSDRDIVCSGVDGAHGLEEMKQLTLVAKGFER
jgi:hypothetical protein